MHVYTVNYMISAIHNSISFFKVLYFYFFLLLELVYSKFHPELVGF